MINYEKLKTAHELILKINGKHAIACYVGCTFNPYYRLYALNSDWFEDYEDLDDVINKCNSIYECQHESDGIEYAMNDEGGSFSINRCKNCGEFYK